MLKAGGGLLECRAFAQAAASWVISRFNILRMIRSFTRLMATHHTILRQHATTRVPTFSTATSLHVVSQ
jgi:hypothetical protein